MEETKSKLQKTYEVHFFKKTNDNKENFEKIRQKLGSAKLAMPQE